MIDISEKFQAIQYIKSQAQNGYIDLGSTDQTAIAVVLEALDLYEAQLPRRDYTKDLLLYLCTGVNLDI